MSAPPGTLICDDPVYQCDCCEREVTYVRGSLWHGADRICRACFHLWYEMGITDPVALKAAVLKAEAEGEYPFPSTEVGIARA